LVRGSGRNVSKDLREDFRHVISRRRLKWQKPTIEGSFQPSKRLQRTALRAEALPPRRRTFCYSIRGFTYKQVPIYKKTPKQTPADKRDGVDRRYTEINSLPHRFREKILQVRTSRQVSNTTAHIMDESSKAARAWRNRLCRSDHLLTTDLKRENIQPSRTKYCSPCRVATQQNTPTPLINDSLGNFTGLGPTVKNKYPRDMFGLRNDGRKPILITAFQIGIAQCPRRTTCQLD